MDKKKSIKPEASPIVEDNSEVDEPYNFTVDDDDLDGEFEEGENSEDEEEEDEWGEDEDEWETEDDFENEFEFIYGSDENLKPPSPKHSLPDVDGAIPKAVLKKLPNSTIRKIIIHVKKHILMLETENYLYEKTIEKLEASEKEIDSRVPNNAEEFEEYLKKTRVLICSSDSEPEPDDNGVYEPLNAAEEVRMSQDSFFENMSDNSKSVAYNFFRSVGDLAPAHYDVMRHKYGDYVGMAVEKTDFVGEPGVKTRLKSKIFTSRMQLDDKMSSAAAAVLKPAGRKDSIQAKAVTSTDSGVDDEEFAGFNLADAKKLSIADRLRFAIEEEEEFRKRFYHHETQALKDESSIQIHIDAHKHALGILMGIRKDFRLITKGASGTGMNGKVMADLLVKFRRKMRNQLSAEETKARISIRKVLVQRKRTLEQLKTNKEAGRTISHIDFEYLLCESSILEAEINGMNTTMQHLKDLTAQFHLVLQDERHMLDKMIGQERKMNQELKRRHDLLHHFHDSYVKYRQQIVEANLRMDTIKKKLSEIDAPQPIDYIRLKATQYNLESEVRALERKLEEVSVSLITIKDNYQKHVKHLPGGKTTEMENEEWLNEIKKEVEDKGIVDFDEDDYDVDFDVVLSDTEMSDSVHGSVAPIWANAHEHAAPTTTASRSQGRLPNVSLMLLAPRRFDAHKVYERRSKAPVYDLDYDFDPEMYDEIGKEEG